MGYAFYIVGDFSNWGTDVATKGIKLTYNDGINTGVGTFKEGQVISYKIVKAAYENPSSSGITWEAGSNRTLTVSTAETITITGVTW